MVSCVALGIAEDRWTTDDGTNADVAVAKRAMIVHAKLFIAYILLLFQW